ncbi:MAG: hypothetical protein AB2806_04210 [Candidatus Thiodiazotropha sp.]
MAFHENTGFLELPTILNRDNNRLVLPEHTLRRAIESNLPDNVSSPPLQTSPTQLFSRSPFFISKYELIRITKLIDAIETVVRNPNYQERVLSWAPRTAQLDPGVPGVFIGYDFHIGNVFPQLIEINTNAGGALLNTALAREYQKLYSVEENNQLPGPNINSVEDKFVDMFRKEWKASHPKSPLNCIAIVDNEPEGQFLNVEFHLFKKLFEKHGIFSIITDPCDLALHTDGLWFGDHKVDMIYNRLTDFALEEPCHKHIKSAYLNNQTVVTPHPHAHAIYADKRNLVLLSDDALMRSWGISEKIRSVLRAGVPQTYLVTRQNSNELWHLRRRLFFKPASGYGSKAAYRGDKLTKRVWQEIIDHKYVAQEIIPPGERHLRIGEENTLFKVDIRSYVYSGQTQLLAARMYRGQTTNFRTPGGGFAAIYVIESPVRSGIEPKPPKADPDFIASH